jgi:hypothetical protein
MPPRVPDKARGTVRSRSRSDDVESNVISTLRQARKEQSSSTENFTRPTWKNARLDKRASAGQRCIVSVLHSVIFISFARFKQ